MLVSFVSSHFWSRNIPIKIRGFPDDLAVSGGFGDDRPLWDLVKAAPERIRRASEEESLSLSSWLEGLVKRKNDPCTDPKNGFLDLTEHDLPPEQRLESGVYGDDRDGPMKSRTSNRSYRP